MNPNFSIQNIIGQETAVRFIQNYIQKPHTIPPLLLFYGPSGTGKWSLAERFAFNVLCKKGIGCGNCESCRLFLMNEHPDYIVFPNENKSIQIGKDDDKKGEDFTVRWLLAKRIPYTPHISKFRLILIPDASQFTDEAESALLKTLEEPPEHTRFIFLVEDLLNLKQTIISRSVCIPFNYLSQDSLHQILNLNPDLNFEKYYGGSLSPINIPSVVLQIIEDKFKESVSDPLLILEFETWIKHYKEVHPEWDGDSFRYPIFIEAVLLVMLYIYDVSNISNKYSYMEEILNTKELLYNDISNIENFLLSKLFFKLCI